MFTFIYLFSLTQMDNSIAKEEEEEEEVVVVVVVVYQAHCHYYFSMKGFLMHWEKNVSILNQAKMN
jgi:hypothetical protein